MPRKAVRKSKLAALSGTVENLKRKFEENLSIFDTKISDLCGGRKNIEPKLKRINTRFKIFAERLEYARSSSNKKIGDFLCQHLETFELPVQTEEINSFAADVEKCTLLLSYIDREIKKLEDTISGWSEKKLAAEDYYRNLSAEIKRVRATLSEVERKNVSDMRLTVYSNVVRERLTHLENLEREYKKTVGTHIRNLETADRALTRLKQLKIDVAENFFKDEKDAGRLKEKTHILELYTRIVPETRVKIGSKGYLELLEDWSVCTFLKQLAQKTDAKPSAKDEYKLLDEFGRIVTYVESVMRDCTGKNINISDVAESLNSAKKMVESGNYENGLELVKTVEKQIDARVAEYNIRNALGYVQMALEECKKIGIRISDIRKFIDLINVELAHGNYKDADIFIKKCEQLVEERMAKLTKLRTR